MDPMTLSDEEQKRRIERREERLERAQIAGIILALILGIAGVSVAFYAARSHGVPHWLVVVGFFCGAIVVVLTVGFAWLGILAELIDWAVTKPIPKLKKVAQKDDLLTIFTVLITPLQALIFFVSSEIVENKIEKIALGIAVFVFAITGGVCAVLARTKKMYFCGAGAVVLSVLPVALAAWHYQRWMGHFWKLDIFHQAIVIASFLAAIFVVVFVLWSWPQVKRAPKVGAGESETSSSAP
jgi:hypothetical protein